MDWSSVLRIIRLVGVGLVLLGIVGVGVGAASAATYSCETTYGVSADTVQSPEAEPTALENLSESERNLARTAIREGNADAPNASVANSLAARTVRYEGATYRFVQYHGDCAGNSLILFLHLGGTASLAGALLGGGSHLALR
jgi:hypothetical protein